MRLFTRLVAGTVTVAVAACVTRNTRSVMRVQPGSAARVEAEALFGALGYRLVSAPPSDDTAVRRRAWRAWRWWPGWSSPGSRGRPVRQAFWVRARPDGGWDQLGVSEATASSSGGNNASGGNPPVFWSRWVINAGTFGRDGRERWPSREVRADADSAIGIMWRVQHTPVVAADTSATPWPEALLRPAPVVVGVLPRWR